MIRTTVLLTLAAALAACAPAGGGGSGGTSGSGISQAAGESACRGALVQYHNMNDVRVVSSEPYQGGGRFVRASVRAGAGGQRELWQCIAYGNGTTGELKYLAPDGNANTGGSNADDGLAGTDAQFNAMTAPCIDQAARFANYPARDINITDRVRTGGGPLLVLDAGGQRLSCRLEADGSVTVFSEYAN